MYYVPDGLKEHLFIVSQSGGWKSEIKAPSEAVGENLLRASLLASHGLPAVSGL